jgi:hypothetical protein
VKRFVQVLPRLYRTVLNKYYIDEFYDVVIVRPLRRTAAALWMAIDSFVIDMVLVNGVGFLVGGIGKLVKYLQNGDMQRYVIAILIGAAVMLWGATSFTARKAREFTTTTSGHEVTVTAGAERGLEYTVDWHDGQSSGPQANATFRHNYESAGAKTITLTVVDARWGSSATSTQKVELP